MTMQDAPLAIRAKHADYGLYLLGASIAGDLRQKIWILSLLYNELNSLINSTSEEMVGHIRLAWWREHIEALHHDADAVSPAHPLLIELTPLISEIALDAWSDFFDYYATLLSTSHEAPLTLMPSPILELLEKSPPRQPIDSAIKTLWSAGELAISKVTPHLHYRYDMALIQSDNKEEPLIKAISDHHKLLKKYSKNTNKYSNLEKYCLCISSDRIMRISRSKYVMHHVTMLRPSVMLPFKLWLCTLKT